MMIFHKLGRLAAYERQHMRFIQTNEDRDILVAIGRANETGKPIGLKQLVLASGIATSTLIRRLKRLMASGVVSWERQDADGRMVSYCLSAATQRSFDRYVKLAQTLF